MITEIVVNHVGALGTEQRPIDKMDDFRESFHKAKIHNYPYLIVTKSLMSLLLQGLESSSLMYDGLRLYTPGCREEIEFEEGLSAERRADYLAKKAK